MCKQVRTTMRRSGGWLLLGGLALLIMGCNDDPDQLVLGARAPEDLTVRGTVFAASLAATRGAPLAGVAVRLSGDGSQATPVLTDAAGEFRFTDLPTGRYRVMAQKAGYQRAFSEEVVLMPGATDLPDGTTVTVDLDLRSHPILLQAQPTDQSVIPPGALTAGFIFNEPLEPSTVGAGLYLLGGRDGGGATRRLAATTAWDDQGLTLILAPVSPLPPASIFEARLETSNRILDRDGFPLDLTGSGGGLTSTVIRFYTAAGGMPVAVAGLTADVAGIPAAELDWLRLRTVAGGLAAIPLGLGWLPAGTPPPDGFRVYGGCGPYPLVELAEGGWATSWRINLGELVPLLTGVQLPLDPLAHANVPVLNCSLVLSVAAFNADGEGAAASVTLADVIPPALRWAGRASPGGGLPELNDPLQPALYLGFSEPVVWTAEPIQVFRVTVGGQLAALAAAETVWAGGEPLTVGEAQLGSVVQLTFPAPLPAGEVLVQVAEGLTDLLGNPLPPSTPQATFGPFAL